MRIQLHSFVIAMLAGLSVLAPWSVTSARGQADERDLEIKLLKAKIEVQQKDFELLQKQARATTDRLKREIDQLNNTIKERETMVIELEAVVKKYRLIALESERKAKSVQIQIENLLDELRGKLGSIRTPNEPNPPSVDMSGKIEKVEGTLVQISLGTDHGLKETNTLHAYRLKPEPKYLGMIRIVDARHHTAVGRLIPVGKKEDRPTLKEGDLVTSNYPMKDESKKKIRLPNEDGLRREKNVEPPPNGNDPLPPAEKVDGKIEKVDGNLVRLNVGKDHGVAKDHTLDVYRLLPNPAYLGTVRIVEVSNASSVGRFQPRGKQSAVKEGDLVTSKIK